VALPVLGPPTSMFGDPFRDQARDSLDPRIAPL